MNSFQETLSNLNSLLTQGDKLFRECWPDYRERASDDIGVEVYIWEMNHEHTYRDWLTSVSKELSLLPEKHYLYSFKNANLPDIKPTIAIKFKCKLTVLSDIVGELNRLPRASKNTGNKPLQVRLAKRGDRLFITNQNGVELEVCKLRNDLPPERVISYLLSNSANQRVTKSTIESETTLKVRSLTDLVSKLRMDKTLKAKVFEVNAKDVLMRDMITISASLWSTLEEQSQPLA